MPEEIVTEKQRMLIERLGVFYEQEGFHPAGARIMALLIIADRNELTFDEMREALNISKSATSTAINLLLNTKRIEYITNPGERKRYFRATIVSWKLHMKEKLEGMITIGGLMHEILDQRPASTAEFNTSLRELVSFMTFFHQEIPLLIERWKASQKN
ncbi:MAG: MarR family transcriptional regulator [Cytophagales bacterium]|nr:MarR family transcriptional regulator [Cytophaga sp.]